MVLDNLNEVCKFIKQKRAVKKRSTFIIHVNNGNFSKRCKEFSVKMKQYIGIKYCERLSVEMIYRKVAVLHFSTNSANLDAVISILLIDKSLRKCNKEQAKLLNVFGYINTYNVPHDKHFLTMRQKVDKEDKKSTIITGRRLTRFTRGKSEELLDKLPKRFYNIGKVTKEKEQTSFTKFIEKNKKLIKKWEEGEKKENNIYNMVLFAKPYLVSEPEDKE